MANVLNYKIVKKGFSFREALTASGVMAFAGMGDTILYSILPVYGKQIGFSVVYIGILLSVNRFVRILANTSIANVVNIIGMRKVLLISSVLAILTTFMYGMEIGFIGFLIARILWGISYSGLKLSTLNYAAHSQKTTGLAFGIVKSIKALGGLFILWVGPLIIGALGIQLGLRLIALMSGIGIVLALTLPNKSVHKKEKRVKAIESFKPNAINGLVFMFAFVIDGILVVTLTNLFRDGISTSQILLVTVAFYLFLKRGFATIVSLLVGVLSLKMKPQLLFNISATISILGLVFIAFSWVKLGVVLAFLFNTILVTFSPLIAIKSHKHTLQAISGISTWWDLGAAIGAFSGIYLIQNLGTTILYILSVVLLLSLFINFIMNHGKTD